MDEDVKTNLQVHGVFFSEADDPIVFLEGNRIAIVIDPRYEEDAKTFGYTSLMLTSNVDPNSNPMLVYAYGVLELMAHETDLVAEAGKVRIAAILEETKKEQAEEIAKAAKKKPSRKKKETSNE